MLQKLRRLVEVVREAWLVNRAPANVNIFGNLECCLGSDDSGRAGIERYLLDRPAMGRFDVTRDWYRADAPDETRLDYETMVFAAGRLRIRRTAQARGVLVFLSGHQMTADEVLVPSSRPKCLASLARDLHLDLACWDWPLQGERLNGCLFRGLRSVYSAEREYSRILPALGTSLWREYVAELEWALQQIHRLVGRNLPIHLVGWSMGGAFAYVAPLLGTPLASITAVGSCACLADLIAEGKTRRHGFFFYPADAAHYFDLDNVMARVLEAGNRMHVVYGDADEGCLDSSRRRLLEVAARSGGKLAIEVLPNHSHVFSSEVRDRIARIVGAEA